MANTGPCRKIFATLAKISRKRIKLNYMNWMKHKNSEAYHYFGTLRTDLAAVYF